MSRLPRFPTPRRVYDEQNEAQFRRDLATFLSGIQGFAGSSGSASSVAWADITGKPTTLAGFGITDGQQKIERAIVSVTTASLANGDIEEGEITLGKTSFLLLAEADVGCWVRLYGTEGERAADSGRLITSDPTNDAPVLCELIFDDDHLSIPMAPLIGLTNRDGTPVTTIYYSIQNLAGSTGTVTVDFTRIILEH